jgi:uncharacterized membrane protein YecN with MAPEG domain
VASALPVTLIESLLLLGIVLGVERVLHAMGLSFPTCAAQKMDLCYLLLFPVAFENT